MWGERGNVRLSFEYDQSFIWFLTHCWFARIFMLRVEQRHTRTVSPSRVPPSINSISIIIIIIIIISIISMTIVVLLELSASSAKCSRHVYVLSKSLRSRSERFLRSRLSRQRGSELADSRRRVCRQGGSTHRPRVRIIVVSSALSRSR